MKNKTNFRNLFVSIGNVSEKVIKALGRVISFVTIIYRFATDMYDFFSASET